MDVARPVNRRTRALRVGALLASLATGAHAQDARLVLGGYRLDIWRSQGAVRLAHVSNLTPTRDGFLWLSTQSGLARFDGVRFAIFDGDVAPALRNRPRLLTYPLFEARDGALWIASDSGLLVRERDGFAPAVGDAGFAADLINAATEDARGTIWAVTRSGRLFRMTRGRPPEPVVTGDPAADGAVQGFAITADAQGDVWLAVRPAGLVRLRDGRPHPLPHRGATGELAEVTALRIAPDGALWAGTPTSLLRIAHDSVARFPLPRPDRFAPVRCLAIGADGVVWAGTDGVGLYRFADGRFTRLDQQGGLSDDRVEDVLVDRSGSVWASTRDGLNRLRPVPFSFLSAAEGLPSSQPGAVMRGSDGTLWLASLTGGLWRGASDGRRARFVVHEAPVPGDRITAIAPAAMGGIWIGRLQGTLTYDGPGGRRTYTVADGLPGTGITDVLEARDGTVWFGTWRGLGRLRAGRLTMLHASDGLPDDGVHRLREDEAGVLWVATQTGLARVRAGGDSIRAVPMPRGAASRASTLLRTRAGHTWIGTADGLAVVAGDSVHRVTTAQGLPEDWVGALEEDAEGNLWVGGLTGIARLPAADAARLARGDVRTPASLAWFTALGGLPGGDPTVALNHPSMRGADGRLWFVLPHGLAIVDPARVAHDTAAPPVFIEEVRLDGVAIDSAAALRIPPSARRLDVRFTGVNLDDGAGVRFRYRLDGVDEAWIDAGTERTASFTRLAPGRYRFRVAARNVDGTWPEREASVALHVLPPFWRTPWFVAGAVLVLALGMWALARARERMLRERFAGVLAERVRLAREMHDTLLQGMAGIGMHLSAAARSGGLPPAQQAVLDRLAGLADEILVEARAAVWNLREHDRDGPGLVEAVRAAAAAVFREDPHVVRIEAGGPARPLEAETERQLARIVQEALVNARDHARARAVVVTITFAARELVLAVRDDGAGFDAARPAPDGHWGLQGMRERAAQVGGTATITSAPGAGTVVTVRVPLDRARAGRAPRDLAERSIARPTGTA